MPSMVCSLCASLAPGGLLCLSGVRPHEIGSLKEAYGTWVEWEDAIKAAWKDYEEQYEPILSMQANNRAKKKYRAKKMKQKKKEKKKEKRRQDKNKKQAKKQAAAVTSKRGGGGDVNDGGGHHLSCTPSKRPERGNRND